MNGAALFRAEPVAVHEPPPHVADLDKLHFSDVGIAASARFQRRLVTLALGRSTILTHSQYEPELTADGRRRGAVHQAWLSAEWGFRWSAWV